MTARLKAARIASDWNPDTFPKNLPRVKGTAGALVDLAVVNGVITNRVRSDLKPDLSNAIVRDGAAYFDGKSAAIRLPFGPRTDSAGWPFRIRLEVKPDADGVIATQGSRNFGFKIFVQDGRPGFAVQCRTWVDTTTTLDGSDSIIGKWTELEALIDFNRIAFVVNGRVVETMSIPQPYKGSPRVPFIIGNVGEQIISADVPHEAFTGSIRNLTLSRGLSN
jgi:hypothetical protein